MRKEEEEEKKKEIYLYVYRFLFLLLFKKMQLGGERIGEEMMVLFFSFLLGKPFFGFRPKGKTKPKKNT